MSLTAARTVNSSFSSMVEWTHRGEGEPGAETSAPVPDPALDRMRGNQPPNADDSSPGLKPRPARTSSAEGRLPSALSSSDFSTFASDFGAAGASAFSVFLLWPFAFVDVPATL